MMRYNTGVLIGRAFALANGFEADPDRAEAVAELCALAAGDRTALVLAKARYEEFLAGPTPTEADADALDLLAAALECLDALVPV